MTGANAENQRACNRMRAGDDHSKSSPVSVWVRERGGTQACPLPPFRQRLLQSLAWGLLASVLIPGFSHAAVLGAAELGKPEPFSFDLLIERAEALAKSPFTPLDHRYNELVHAIDGRDLQGIQMRDNARLWYGDEGRPFQIKGTHRSHHQGKLIRLFTVEEGEAREWQYRKTLFSYKDPSLARSAPSDLGFGGFRVVSAETGEAWLSHSGTSFFGAIGIEGHYGASARGIVIDPILSNEEELPVFTHFWLEQPPSEHPQIHIYALLEGPSLTGAYQFIWRREEGKPIIAEVDARLFLREDVATLGIAPINSMYWFGENDRREATDWRPEVHDSDGLLMRSGGGEQIWRPLTNPPHTNISSFSDINPIGFGLLQRDRDFSNYQDTEQSYHAKPDLWIEPLNDWGQGTFQLVEQPTDSDRYDNVLLYWNPRESAMSGSQWRFAYRIRWGSEVVPKERELARVVATRLGRADYAGEPRGHGTTRFVIDFEDAAPNGSRATLELEGVLHASRGEIENFSANRVIGTSFRRIMFDLTVSGREPVDLRLHLEHDGAPQSETWLYQFQPQSVPWGVRP